MLVLILYKKRVLDSISRWWKKDGKILLLFQFSILNYENCIINCCGVSEKNNDDFFYAQNKKEGFVGNSLTIRNDYDIEFSNKFKNKMEKEIEKEKPKKIDNLETNSGK